VALAGRLWSVRVARWLEKKKDSDEAARKAALVDELAKVEARL
jgi:hypothetical protein